MNIPYISKPNEITNEDYHTGETYKPFISSSILKQISISPKWLRYSQDHPEDDRITASWKLEGGCWHEMLASIANSGGLDDFNKRCVIFDPPVNEKTGRPYGHETAKYIEAYQSVIDVNPGKDIYGKPEYDLAEAMIRELIKGNDHLSPVINNLLKLGKAEVSSFMQHRCNNWVQYDSGLFKWRKDLFTETKIIDWKSVVKTRGKEAPLKPEGFARVIEDRDYGFSAAMYQYFDWMLTGKWRSFYWVVQDKEPPYDFNIISADGWAFEVIGGEMVGIGVHAMRFIKSLEQYLYCLETDKWPGVSIFTKPDFTGKRIAKTDVPGYVNSKSFDYFN